MLKLYISIALLIACFTFTIQTDEILIVKNGYKQFGIASYYHDRFNGKVTANGERYDKNKLTCAHRFLPFGSMVEVKNLQNGKKVKVRINDRGAFIEGRIIDLSKKAGKAIGILKQGITEVSVTVLN